MSQNLITNPLRLSQPAGAALAYLGIKGSIPLWHGVQGCTAFAKILMLGHFREPVPYQTTAMGHNEVVMGGEGNLLTAINNLKNDGELIAVLTTGVSETSGCDLQGILRQARSQHPNLALVGVDTPDFQGSLETGYKKAVKALLQEFVQPHAPMAKQVAVFVGPFFTPREVGRLKEICKDLGWRPLMLPDLSQSLIGRLLPQDRSSASIDGLSLDDLKTLGGSEMVLSLGSSMQALAADFAQTHGKPHQHFNHLGLPDELDLLFKTLLQGRPLPVNYRNEREHLLDMLLDVESLFYGKRAWLAGDPEFLTRYSPLLNGMGIQTQVMCSLPEQDYPLGDVHDLESQLQAQPCDLVLGNSWVCEMAEHHQLPALRLGLPIHDRVGGQRLEYLGYWGAASLFQNLANCLLQAEAGVTPYVSPLKSTLTQEAP